MIKKRRMVFNDLLNLKNATCGGSKLECWITFVDASWITTYSHMQQNWRPIPPEERNCYLCAVPVIYFRYIK